MKKIIILSSVLLIAIAFIAIKYFSELTGTSKNSSKILKYIPADAALIINFSNEDSFYDILKGYELFDELIGEQRSAEITQLRSMLLSQPGLSAITAEKKIFISFHQLQTDSLDYLFSMGINESVNPKEALTLLSDLPGVKCTQLAQNDIYKLEFNTLNRPFYLYLASGVATGSYSKALLEVSINAKTEKILPEFIEEINKETSKTQSTPINLFINQRNLAAFVSSFFKGKASGNLLLLKNLRGFGILGMNFKSDALMFNGNSIPDTSSANYLNTFLNQQPVKNELKIILPFNTANYISFGISNHRQFHKSLENYFSKKSELRQLRTQLKMIQATKSLSIDQDLLPKLGNEFLIFETAQKERLALIKLHNGTALETSLALISSKSSAVISQLNYSNIFYYCLGEPMKLFTRPYFQIIDNFLVVANSQGAITRYMESYNSNNFLVKSKDFKEHDQLVSGQSNITFFVDNKNSQRIIQTSLRNRYSNLFANENSGLRNFYGLSIQWSSAKTYFQTNIYANYNGLGKQEFKRIWSFKMNARIASAPYVFMDGDKKIIMLQDNVYNLYAISDEGKKIWATQLPGTIRSKLYQLNDQSILFNTEDKIFRIRPNGSAVEGFPVSLPLKTSYGLTLTGTNPAVDHIFLAAQNTILGYDLAGKRLDNWNKTLPNRIGAELLYSDLENEAHIIAVTRPGEFHFFNARSGALSYKVAEKSVVTEFKNSIFPSTSETNANSSVITTDTAGIIHEIVFNGSITRTALGVWNKRHVFGYKNISGDSNSEYIYLDDNSLSAFNKDHSPVFSFDFEDSAERNLQFFVLDGSTWSIGVSSYANNELYLFDNEGNLSKGFPIKGLGEFYIGSIRKDGLQYLICGSKDGYLYGYKL